MSTTPALTRAAAPIAPGAAIDEKTAEYLQVRRRLIGIADRRLCGRNDAEDVVQDAWLRWHGADHRAVLNPTAFLVTTTTRLAINAASSARVRHEAVAGAELPEPVDHRADAAQRVLRYEELQVGVRRLLERLHPTERAAFVLRQAFDYPYVRIAELLHLSEANARQLVSRAGRRLSAPRCRAVDPEDQQHLVHAFIVAARLGDLEVLERALVGAVRAEDPCFDDDDDDAIAA